MTWALRNFNTQLRDRASVLVEFELDWLGLSAEHDDERAELGRFLSEDAQPGPSRGGSLPRWRVRDAVRQAAARDGLSGLIAARQAVNEHPEHALQVVIDACLDPDARARGPIDLTDLPPAKLRAVAQVSRWFDSAGPPFPRYEDAEVLLRRQLLLDPLRDVATEYFRDRDRERKILSAQEPGRTILITGRGGIGKSALLDE